MTMASRLARRPAKSRRQHIKLGGAGSARRRLHMAHHGEIALEPRQQLPLGAALQHFGDEKAAGGEHLASEIRRQIRERDDLEMIRRLVARRVGGHVGHDAIGPAAEHRLDELGRVLVVEILDRERDPRDRLHVEQIDADDLALSLGDLHPLGRDLRPAAGRGAKIDDAHSRLQKMIALVHLQQLIGRAGAISVALGARDIRVVELSLQP